VRRRTTIGFVVFLIMIVAGAFMFYLAYYNSFYAINRATALFSRAETAGFAEDMIAYLQRGRVLLPKSGNPVWWFPTDKTDFGEIQHDIDGIISRATILESLARNSTAYQTGMDDLRGRIIALNLQLADVSGYMFVSGYNMAVAVVWLAIFGILAFWVRRRQP
jgi:ABC-type multidrug transport system fused ATPase/permease subunit